MIKSKEEIEQAALNHAATEGFVDEHDIDMCKDIFTAGYNLSTADHAEVNKWVDSEDLIEKILDCIDEGEEFLTDGFQYYSHDWRFDLRQILRRNLLPPAPTQP